MIKQGIHPGLGMKEYHAWKLDKGDLAAGPISCSMLKDFRANPFAWAKAPERKATGAMRTGSLFDAALTDPDELDAVMGPKPKLPTNLVVLDFPSYATKDARKWRDEAVARGMQPVLASKLPAMEEDVAEGVAAWEAEKAHAIAGAEAVRNHKTAGAILDGCEFQLGVVGEVMGLPAKCLLDILPSESGHYAETIVDYKTTEAGLSDDDLARTIGKWGYHFQAAFYRSLFNKVHPTRHCEDFLFIFQCVKTLEVRVVKLDDADLIRGGAVMARAIAEFKDAAENGIRSRYAEGISAVSVPGWQASIEEEES